MKNKITWFLAGILCILTACSPKREVTIYLPENAGAIENLAAREIRKYIYLRSGTLADIHSGFPSKKVRGWVIVLTIDVLKEKQEFGLKSYQGIKDKVIRITGGSPQALLYAAYELAEQLGIRFYLHGDVIPDEKVTFWLPDVDIQKKPLFETRGILPFHDFPEGPDWWNENDYKAIIAQLPKLKMNFIGFHTYPWRSDFNGEGPKAEPLVWIGREADVNGDGTLKTAYPVLHFHTGDSTWGYRPANTSEFLSGASQLFETGDYGADYMKGLTPWPHSDEENKEIFHQSGKVFASAFSFARELGVSVCVGTETPLIVPGPLKDMNAGTDQEIKAFYRGMFSRIQKAYPIDYYWLWTPESWTWEGVEDKVVARTERDMQLAYEALHEMGSPFTLATCGWVLGPPKDRKRFDRVLPKDMPFSCINRGVGYTPVEKDFAGITDRSKWSIPWMEDDPALLTAQLWAGRMRKDAFDSWQYGCTGLLGIHWRTRSIGPGISSLAKAAWDCDQYTAGTGYDMSLRDLPVEDFYTDWVFSEFGIRDQGLVKIFTRLDGKGVESKEGYKGDAPLVASDWIRGPGALMVNREPGEIQEMIGRYEFLADLEAYQGHISGAGNLERFAYWLNSYRFNEAVLEVTLSQIELNRIVERMKKVPDLKSKQELATREALPKRIELAERWETMNRILLSFVSTNGELGTIANLEMHNIRMNGNLTGHDDYLQEVLEAELPAETRVSKNYSGKTRIIATSNLSILQKGKDYYTRIRVLSETGQVSAKINYRRLGERKYSTLPMKRMAPHVFEVSIPGDAVPDDFEYYIEVETDKEIVKYPATAGNINNAVIVL